MSLTTATSAKGAENSFEFLRIEQDGPIATVSMTRAPVNAVNQKMYGEIRDCFTWADELMPGARVVIFRGEGKHFCAGNDLDEFGTMTLQNSPARMKLVREAFSSVYDCPIPTIAAVQGVAAGTGVSLCSLCDVIICGESARLVTPEVSIGVMGAARHLARVVPEHIMRRMYYTAEPVPAADLVQFGGIDSVVPDAELLDTARALAARMAVHSGAALRQAKEVLNQVEFLDVKTGYEIEQRATARLSGHPDSLEGRAAVLEKRAPKFADA
ncbi:unannotated protein [freshwater metagenome]|uniref:Unannotated protein n=1 Tax=freshwater metagenome TaxID=449393 RepID=A0A6J7J416_9ZZZZ|nr:crotonase [Actinomycetota bacterium]